MIDTTLVEWPPGNATSIIFAFAALSFVYYIGQGLFDVYFGPLSHIPGPKINAFSILPSILTNHYGNENTDIPALHAKYGPIVRVKPNHISYANGQAGFKEIYGFGKKGLYKDPQFYGRPINKVHGIITSNDADHSRQRKIVSHAFSDRALKEQEPLLKEWVSLMKQKLMECAVAGEKADMLKYYNCTTL